MQKKWILGSLMAAFIAQAQALSPVDDNVSTLQCPENLAVGETWRVSLPSNASTGYQWQIREQSETLTLLGEDYVSPPSLTDRPMVGVPGTHVWNFQANQAGEAFVNLVYVRPWEHVAVGQSWQCRFDVLASR